MLKHFWRNLIIFMTLSGLLMGQAMALSPLTYDSNGKISSASADNKIGATVAQAIANKKSLAADSPQVMKVMKGTGKVIARNATNGFAKKLGAGVGIVAAGAAAAVAGTGVVGVIAAAAVGWGVFKVFDILYNHFFPEEAVKIDLSEETVAELAERIKWKSEGVVPGKTKDMKDCYGSWGNLSTLPAGGMANRPGCESLRFSATQEVRAADGSLIKSRQPKWRCDPISGYNHYQNGGCYKLINGEPDLAGDVIPAIKVPYVDNVPMTEKPPLTTEQTQEWMAPGLMVEVANKAWQEASQEAGYDGPAYDPADPLTEQDFEQIKINQPGIYPKVGDAITAPADTSTMPWGPVIVKDAYTDNRQAYDPATEAPPTTGTNPTPTPTPQCTNGGTNYPTCTPPTTSGGTQIDGSYPNTPPPNLDDVPLWRVILAPLLNAFGSWKEWTLPEKAGSCPTIEVRIPYTENMVGTDEHCKIVEANKGVIHTGFMLGWIITAFTILMGA